MEEQLHDDATETRTVAVWLVEGEIDDEAGIGDTCLNISDAYAVFDYWWNKSIHATSMDLKLIEGQVQVDIRPGDRSERLEYLVNIAISMSKFEQIAVLRRVEFDDGDVKEGWTA